MTESGDAAKAVQTSTKTKPEKPKTPKGTVQVLVERCKACGNCVIFCPKDVLVMSEEYNERGYHFPCVAKPEDCTACRLCELLCGEFAVFVQVNKPATKPAKAKKGPRS